MRSWRKKVHELRGSRVRAWVRRAAGRLHTEGPGGHHDLWYATRHHEWPVEFIWALTVISFPNKSQCVIFSPH